jgi:N-acetylglucosamine malate deacetylase 2
MELRKANKAHAYLFGSRQLSRLARCAIIVAHPSDEVAGAGYLICKLDQVTVVHVSDGAPRQVALWEDAGFARRRDYAEARRKECACALAIAHIPAERIVEFDYMALDLPRRLISLTRRIKSFLMSSSCEIVLTHAFDGGHPDHDATAFATHGAVNLLKRNGLKAPVIFEFGVYPASDGRTRILDFLPGPGKETTTLVLDGKATNLKLRMFDCFWTQGESLKTFPFALERFRRAPSYDFRQPPNCGTPYYESFDWGLTGEEWQALADDALNELFTGERKQPQVSTPRG